MSAALPPAPVRSNPQQLARQLGGLLATSAVDRDRDGDSEQGLRALGEADELLAAPALTEATGILAAVAAGDPGVAHVLAGQYLAQFAAGLFGNVEQRELVDRVLGGGQRFTWVQPAGWAFWRQAPTASGGLRLSGAGAHVTGAQSDGWLAVASRPTAANRSVAFVPVRAASWESEVDLRRPFGLRTVPHGRISLDAVAVPGAHVVISSAPTGGPALEAVAQLLDAAVELGIGRAALEHTAEHVRTRTRAAFEADEERAADEPHLIRRVGDLIVPLHAAEQLLEQATAALAAVLAGDLGTPPEPALLRVAELRVVARDAVVAATSQSLELAGASASDARHGLDRFWRDAQAVFTLGSPAWGPVELGERTLGLAGL